MIKTKSAYGKTLYVNKDNINFISVDKKTVTIYFTGFETGIILEPEDNFCIEEFLGCPEIKSKVVKTKAAPKKRQS